MHKLVVLASISSLYLCGVAIAEETITQRPQTTAPANSAPAAKNTSDPSSDTADITSIPIPPITDEGYKIDGCKYLGDDKATGYDSYECFDKEMHGVNVAAGGKCQSYCFNSEKTKYYCLSDIVRGGRSLVMHCPTGWKYITEGKPDVQCKVKGISKSSSDKAIKQESKAKPEPKN